VTAAVLDLKEFGYSVERAFYMQEYVLMNFYDSSEKSKKVNALFEQVEAAFTKT